MRFSEAGFLLARPLLHALDPEKAHHLTIKALKMQPKVLQVKPETTSRLASQIWGLNFPNPLGLAAGFDKDAEVPEALLGLGFGFVEVGTVTPEPQSGNPKPRLFRLAKDQAIINRMGFNNSGHAAARHSLEKRDKKSGIVGVNIGANKNTVDKAEDYVKGLTTFATCADYFTINISSPNTPGLRNLQADGELRRLLERLNEVRAKHSRPVPMLLKIAPDLTEKELEAIAGCCAKGAVDGVIVSNTTLDRLGLHSPLQAETGGLSGYPLFQSSTRCLAQFYQFSDGKIPLIGVGGITSPQQAWEKICAGASLLQIYSALVFQGPALLAKILRHLEGELRDHNLSSLTQATGCKAHHYSV